MFDSTQVQAFIEGKAFTNANTAKLIQNVEKQAVYEQAGKPEFKDAIKPHFEH